MGALTNFENFGKPISEKLNKSDVKYSMEMAFSNQGGNWHKALKRIEVKGDKIKLNMSSYMAPGELLTKIVNDFNDIMLTDFRVDKDSFQKGHVASVMLVDESLNEGLLLQTVRKSIGKIQTALKKKWKKTGGYENFGQDEINDLKSDGRWYNPYGDAEQRKAAKLIDALDRWAMNYTGESVEFIDEASKDYQFNPSAAAKRLKDREKENIQRYRAAQDREDNFAIGLYELKIKLDKMDLERLKVQTAIHDLKQKYGK